MRGLLLRLALVGLAFHIPAVADRSQDLQVLRGRIEKLQSELDETRGERNEAREQVRISERRIGALLRNLRDTERREHSESARLKDLEQARRREQRELATHQQQLAAAVRDAHARGRQDTLKLLLSQEDPATVNRVLTYYRYLGAARATRIEHLQGSLDRLAKLEDQIAERRRVLEATHAEQLREKQDLEAARNTRRSALARLDADVRNRAQEIERLKRDEDRLARLVREIGSALSASPPPPKPRVAPPAVGKGHWALPVRGRLAARYGSPKAVGDLRWRGIFLAAAEGAPVTAVTHGRVVYADWLRGFGHLLVIDHGNGLMTLYGHNQSLYKGLGDPVEAGETVALSGNTGGPPWPGLYFEVRQQGVPRDPLDWCKL